MKNLIVHRLHRQSIQCIKDAIGTNHQLLQCLKCTIDPVCNNLYILLDNRLYTVPIASKNNINSQNIIGYENSKIVALEYCITMQELYCAYETGDVVRLDTASQVQNDIVATFSSGLQCMKFSPDHEIITAVTGAGTVITMVLDFQVISEVDLHSKDFGEKQFITVGWGKKETQFHGSQGKAAAKAKPEELNASELDSGRPRIAWRGDGALFAVSFLHTITKIRQFKIFDREGVLCYTSEPTNGLEECLAWNSSGGLIATTQRLANKHVIALFEKNGLKHIEFPLPFEPKEVTVKDLSWSPNSDVLAVTCEQPGTCNTILQLWTENNYHWYLKQTIVFSIDNPLIYATWSTTGRYDQKELILLSSREILSCSFNWRVNHSGGKTANDKVVIGVIDGNKTLVTGFKDGIVPPPMAHQSLQIQQPVNAITFAPDIDDETSWINGNTFCTVSCNNSLTFLKQIMDSSSLRYEVLKSYNINCDILYDMKCDLPGNDKCIYAMHHFLWLAKDIILFSVTTDNHNLLCVLSLDETNIKTDDCLTIQKFYVTNSPIEYIIPSPDADTAYVIIDGSTFRYTRDAEELDLMDIVLKELCHQVEVIKIASKDVIVALSHTNCFFINGKEVAKNITSFYVHSDFLLLTTLQHTLICVPLNQNGMEQLSKHDLTVKPWQNGIKEMSFADIYIRRVEKDSYIIAAIPQDSKTILQMPRGNLECIQPRALSLHILRSYLNNCDYLTAFDIMKKQRINLNLIHDHDPQLFVDNAEKFVEDIANPTWVSLFLSELENEDVTSTMYANCYPNRVRCVRSVAALQNNEININKVEKICKLLRDIMEKRHDAANLIQPILVSLVKNQQRQGLEKALEKIKQVKMLENSKESTQCPSPVSADDALKYLLHFVNINVLYDIALGMYDLELTMLVASKSSKDPKEYIPFLNSLKKLNENQMKYSIDMHLKRYESALEHISKDTTRFEKCLNLVRDQKLYAKAMKLFESDSLEHKMVAGAYGEFLLNEKRYQEAGMMFYRSDDLDVALKAFSMSADSWQDAIAVSREMQLRPTDLYELYKVLVERLKAERKYEDAATILRDYLNDVEEAVALLCEGKFWKYAIRIVQDVQRLDLNETHIKPGINEHAENVISRLSEIKQDFLMHKERLALVRAEIRARQTQPRDELICDDGPISSREIADSLSDTSSIAGSTLSQRSRMSTASGRSYRSHKNRRKQERKLLSLKKGSMFEDLGLIHALYQIISNAYKDRDEWYQLIQALIRFKFDERAKKLQIKINVFFQLVESSKSEIWDKTAPTSLAEIERMASYTPAQLQDIIAPIKSVERYITHPPETDTSRVIEIF